MADKDLERRIQEARANGYSDEEIQAYLNPKSPEQLQDKPTSTPGEYYVPEGGVVPRPTYLQPGSRREEYEGMAEFGGGKALETAAELYAGKKFILDPILNRFGNQAPPGPVAPQPTTTPSTGQFPPGHPYSSPAQQTMTPQQQTFETLRTPESQLAQRSTTTQQPSIVQRGIDYASKVRQLAMDKVIQPVVQAAPEIATAAAPYARAAGGITAALMPGNVGQNYPFPMSGPMKGQEINPTTGRPWTREELSAYKSQYGS